MGQRDKDNAVYPTEEELRSDLERALREAAAVLEHSSLGVGAGADEEAEEKEEGAAAGLLM